MTKKEERIRIFFEVDTNEARLRAFFESVNSVLQDNDGVFDENGIKITNLEKDGCFEENCYLDLGTLTFHDYGD